MFLWWYWFTIFSSIPLKLLYGLACTKFCYTFFDDLDNFWWNMKDFLYEILQNPGFFRFASVTFRFLIFSKINIFHDFGFFWRWGCVEQFKHLSRWKTPPDAKVTTSFVRTIFGNFRKSHFWGLSPPHIIRWWCIIPLHNTVTNTMHNTVAVTIHNTVT